MSTATNIQWTETTFNVVTGCDPVSPGCANCYAKKMAKRLKAMGNPRYQKDGCGPGFGVTMHHDLLTEPLRWRKPRLVFVPSMGDLFHEEVTDEFIDRVFAVMGMARRHTFQVLTKQPDRMREWVTSRACGRRRLTWSAFESEAYAPTWPLPNVWLGVSAENQRWLDERVPVLLDTPAAVRFVSAEPLLGPLNMRSHLPICSCGCPHNTPTQHRAFCQLYGRFRGPSLDWVIVGGESGAMSTLGGPERALVERWPLAGLGAGSFAWWPKPEAHNWVRSIRDQCQAAGVPFFFKQWGGPRPKSGGRTLDGREWSEMPERETVTA